VGVQLLSRTTRKVELTAAGEAYYRRVRPLLAEIAAATRDLGQFSPVPIGRLRLAGPAAFVETVLTPLVCAFLAENPGMRVEMHPTESSFDLEADLSFQSLPSPEEGTASIRLAANPWIVCASPGYLKRHGVPTTPDDLAHHNCLVLSTHPHWNFTVDGHKTSLALPAKFFSFGSAVHRAVVDGHGVARLAGFLVNDDIRTGRLVKLLEAYQADDDRSLYLVTQRGNLLVPKFALFAEFVRTKLEHGF
jgi:DNA-binding transcriptional LysR family regulator